MECFKAGITGLKDILFQHSQSLVLPEKVDTFILISIFLLSLALNVYKRVTCFKLIAFDCWIFLKKKETIEIIKSRVEAKKLEIFQVLMLHSSKKLISDIHHLMYRAHYPTCVLK
jgi:hypothetical protein